MSLEDTRYELAPIGHVECRARYRYEAPRQAVMSDGNRAVIKIYPPYYKDGAFAGLEGFERIWVSFVFHLNETWNPQVQPPHENMDKVGVYATRSPHRKNRLGMSCVKLAAVESDHLVIEDHDLLDLTPVVDIKPYLPYADAFPEARTGWLEEQKEASHEIHFETVASEKARFVYEHSDLDVENFVQIQLATAPKDAQRKRIALGEDGIHVISYRTWRIRYTIDENSKLVRILDLKSGYSDAELLEEKDPYEDKDLHRRFKENFKESTTP